MVACNRAPTQACGSGGRWERAVSLLHEMEDDGSTPELESYQAVLEILKDAGQWKQVTARQDRRVAWH